MHANRFSRPVLLVVLVLFVGCEKYVTLTVTNTTEQPIRQIQINYTGGVVEIDDLPSKERRIAKIRPSGESSLSVRYVDVTGVVRSKDADVYLEPGYTGTIEVEVRPNGDVSVVPDVSVQ